MGGVISGSRNDKQTLIFTWKTKLRKGPAKLRTPDYNEKEGYIKGWVVREIIHDPGRGAPLARVSFHKIVKYGLDKQLFVAVKGLRTGQFSLRILCTVGRQELHGAEKNTRGCCCIKMTSCV